MEAVKLKYRGVKIYDRNEEAGRPPSTHAIPPHPEVADIDAVFIFSNDVETMTLRRQGRHSFFNYDSDPETADSARLDMMLRNMVDTVGRMFSNDSADKGDTEQGN